MKKSTLFFVGIASGLFLSQTWKPLTKEGIKLGIRTGRKLREVSQQALEDVADLTAEATQEMSEQDQEVM